MYPVSQREIAKLEADTAAQVNGGLDRITCTVKEACLISGLGQTSVWNMIRAGKVESVYIAGRRLIVIASLRKLLTGGGQ